jgi:hypothetical protein
MMSGTSDAIKYCRDLIAESEGEILTRQNKGWGKSHLDQNDRYAYVMTRKVVPAESTLDNSPEKRTNELLEKMAQAFGNIKVGNREEPADDTARVKALETQLSDLQRKFELLLEATAPKSDGSPKIEDNTVASKEDAQKAVQEKLSNLKKK